jgi:hypothetical protein
MWDERILWAVLIAVLSKLFFSQNTLHHYVAWAIVVVLSFTLMFLKPRQQMLETNGALLLIVVNTVSESAFEGPAGSSPDIQGTYACMTT